MRLLAGLLQIMPVLGEIHGSMYLGERHGSGRHASSPTSIYRCYRSCLPSLPGEEGRWWSRLSSVIWCASSLLVTPREGAMVATSSRVELQCPASIDSPGGEAPSLLSSLMRKLVEVPPENPLDLFPKTHPQSTPKAGQMQPELPSTTRESTTVRPPPAPRRPLIPPPRSMGAHRHHHRQNRCEKRAGLGGVGGVGLVWSKRGGTHTQQQGGRDGGAPRQQGGEWNKKKERKRERIPSPSPSQAQTNPSGGETKPGTGLGLGGRANPDSPPQDANGTPVTLNCASVHRDRQAVLCLAQSARG